MRAAWVATCIFWAWAWAIGSIVWVPFTFGLSLLGLVLAGGSVWAIWIPIGASSKAPAAYGAPPASLPPAQQQPPYYGQQAPPVMPPTTQPHQAGQ